MLTIIAYLTINRSDRCLSGYTYSFVHLSANFFKGRHSKTACAVFTEVIWADFYATQPIFNQARDSDRGTRWAASVAT